MKSFYKIFFLLSLGIWALIFLFSGPSEVDKKLNVWPDIAMNGAIREMRRSMITHDCREVDDVSSSKHAERAFSREEFAAEQYCKKNYHFDRFDISDQQVVAYFNCDAERFSLKYSITYLSEPDEDDRITLCRYSITPK